MKSIAYIVGINGYDQKGYQLVNALNDINALQSVLSELGYYVICHQDPTAREFKDGLASFAREASAGNYDAGLFYFAGHGNQIDGLNYLGVKDTSFNDEYSVKHTSIDLNEVLECMPDNLKIKIYILDACRTTPPNGFRGNQAIGISSVKAPHGSIIAFSTSPGQTASDGYSGGNSLYAQCLLKNIFTKGISIEECFKRIRSDLYHLSGGRQLSWEHTSLIGDYGFNLYLDEARRLNEYSDVALSDGLYQPGDSAIDNVIKKLKFHNWAYQNPAIGEIRNLDASLCTSESQFVLGRNVLQAACGGSFAASSYMNSLERNLSLWTKDDVNHVLNGMLFEMYFNANGQFRTINGLKTIFINQVFALEDNPLFSSAFDFIKGQLEPYKDGLFYVPKSGVKQVIIQTSFEQKSLPYGDLYILREIKFDDEVIMSDDGNSMHMAEIYTNLQSFISIKLGVPESRIHLENNIPDTASANLDLRYPYSMRINRH